MRRAASVRRGGTGLGRRPGDRLRRPVSLAHRTRTGRYQRPTAQERKGACRRTLTRVALGADMPRATMARRRWQPRRAPTVNDPPEVLARFPRASSTSSTSSRAVARRASRRPDARRPPLVRARGPAPGRAHFDASRGVPFRRWANLRIRGAMIDGCASGAACRGACTGSFARSSRGRSLHEAVRRGGRREPGDDAEAADARLTSYLAGMATAMAVGTIAAPRDERIEDAARATARRKRRARGAELVARSRRSSRRLPDAERTLVERHYFGGETLDEAAASLGLSKSWGSRLHARAIEAIARELRAGPSARPADVWSRHAGHARSIVAMSGGVDSSVAAARLTQAARRRRRHAAPLGLPRRRPRRAAATAAAAPRRTSTTPAASPTRSASRTTRSTGASSSRAPSSSPSSTRTSPARRRARARRATAG